MAWPTTNDPRTEHATLRFTVNEANEVDTAAAAVGMNRSQFIRDCVHRCIVANQKAAVRAARTKQGGSGD